MNSQVLPVRHRTTMVLARPTPAKPSPSPNTMKASAPPAPPPRSGSRLRRLAWVGVLLALLGTGAIFRYQATAETPEAHSPSHTTVRQVRVTAPVRAGAGEINLPATLQAYQATDLFARANGFLRAWHVDIGAQVKRGQVLAEIETPELDQELAQAVALLQQGQAEYQQATAELEEAKAEVVLATANVVRARANAAFAVSQANRSEALFSRSAVSREDYESAVRERDARAAEVDSARADLARRKTNLGTRQAIIESRKASVGNREANVQRLRDLTGFQKIVAPFSGIITRRNAEVGMLVTAGSNAGTRPLFSVAQIDLLRVQAAVPQSSALAIKTGDRVEVLIPEKPGQPFSARVTRTAGAVEPTSRSLLVEMELPNQEARLLPGVYAHVRFHSASEQAHWIIPTSTLLMRSDGPHVALVSTGNSLRMQKVTLGRDSGATVEVLNGLQGREQLVVNPADDLRDGQTVQVGDSAAVHVQVSRK